MINNYSNRDGLRKTQRIKQIPAQSISSSDRGGNRTQEIASPSVVLLLFHFVLNFNLAKWQTQTPAQPHHAIVRKVFDRTCITLSIEQITQKGDNKCNKSSNKRGNNKLGCRNNRLIRLLHQGKIQLQIPEDKTLPSKPSIIPFLFFFRTANHLFHLA